MPLFQSWTELFRIAGTAVAAYFFVILAVRVSGKRSTSKMNNFDWIVTVALGSICGSIVLIKDVVLLEGFLAITVLLALQYITTRLAVRSKAVRNLLVSPPSLLYYQGEFLEGAMRKERVNQDEILNGARQQGYKSLDNIAAVILESDAELSFIEGPATDNTEWLENVQIPS